MLIVSILAFILIIGAVIFIHEFGHFLIAKRHKVGVAEFSIGFGPKMFSWVKNGTRYCIRWIPFGGYCRMVGDESAFAENLDSETAEETDDEHAFHKKSVWVRIAVIAAGPIFNFVLAFFLSLLIVALVGSQTSKIGGVSEGYPAAEAGLQAGDRIVKIDHTGVHLFKDITMYMTMHSGEQMEITYERDGERHVTTLEPMYSEEDGRYLIGIYAAPSEKNMPFFKTLEYGWHEFAFNTGAVIKSLGMLITGKASFDDLSGPVGIAGAVNEIVEEVHEDTKAEGFWTEVYWILINLLNITALISANLGIMNLLPIPGLDGGRLIFLFIEAIRGKPIPKKKEGIVTLIGFGLLLLLMLAVFFNDIRKVFFHG